MLVPGPGSGWAECAIHRLAPTCAPCGCQVIGHSVEAGEAICCCANCATAAGGAAGCDCGAQAGFSGSGAGTRAWCHRRWTVAVLTSSAVIGREFRWLAGPRWWSMTGWRPGRPLARRARSSGAGRGWSWRSRELAVAAQCRGMPLDSIPPGRNTTRRPPSRVTTAGHSDSLVSPRRRTTCCTSCTAAPCCASEGVTGSDITATCKSHVGRPVTRPAT
jgi:hypothetical protein